MRVKVFNSARRRAPARAVTASIRFCPKVDSRRIRGRMCMKSVMACAEMRLRYGDRGARRTPGGPMSWNVPGGRLLNGVRSMLHGRALPCERHRQKVFRGPYAHGIGVAEAVPCVSEPEGPVACELLEDGRLRDVERAE